VATDKSQETRNRFLILFLVIFIFVLIARGFYMSFLVYWHQVNWAKRRDRTMLDTREVRFAPQGILLFVRSSGVIVNVLRQCETPFFGSVSRPFSPFKEPRWKANRISESESIVLVEYRFRSEREWYLEPFSSDNHWLNMSPYFPAAPQMSREQWEDLWTKNF